MLDRVLRLPKEKLLVPAAQRLNMAPNWVTFAALVLGLVSAFGATQGWYIFALCFWLANRIVDGLDGEIARLYQRQSDLGAYFDIMTDLLIYALLPLALVWANATPSLCLALAVLISSFYLNAGSWMYLSSILEKRGQGAKQQGEKTGITMPPGLIEGSETVIFFCLFFLLPQQLELLFWLMSLFIGITIIQRLLWAKTHL